MPLWATITFGILAALIISDMGSKILTYGPMPILCAAAPFVFLIVASYWIGGRGLSWHGLLFAGLWGGLVAVTGAGMINMLVDAAAMTVITASEGMTWPAVIIAAPIVEEILKTQPVRRFANSETKSTHTIIAYVWMSAAAFAFVENIGYFAETLDGNYTSSFKEIVILRSLLSIFAHVSFSTPAAVGALAGGRKKWIGLSLSIALHAAWNGMALSGVPLMTWYLTGAVPIFVVVLSYIVWQRIKGERHVINATFKAGVIPGVTEPVSGMPQKLQVGQKISFREWESSAIRVVNDGWTLENLNRASLKRREFIESLKRN